MTETDIMHQIMLDVSAAGNLIFRGNVGKVKLRDGRWFDTGLPKGFSDLFGADTAGYIFFIEVKAPYGRIRNEQKRFLDAMTARGIRAGVAHNSTEALEIVRGERHGY